MSAAGIVASDTFTAVDVRTLVSITGRWGDRTTRATFGVTTTTVTDDDVTEGM